jgi:hypothetical protein
LHTLYSALFEINCAHEQPSSPSSIGCDNDTAALQASTDKKALSSSEIISPTNSSLPLSSNASAILLSPVSASSSSSPPPPRSPSDSKETKIASSQSNPPPTSSLSLPNTPTGLSSYPHPDDHASSISRQQHTQNQKQLQQQQKQQQRRPSFSHSVSNSVVTSSSVFRWSETEFTYFLAVLNESNLFIRLYGNAVTFGALSRFCYVSAAIILFVVRDIVARL